MKERWTYLVPPMPFLLVSYKGRSGDTIRNPVFLLRCKGDDVQAHTGRWSWTRLSVDYWLEYART